MSRRTRVALKLAVWVVALLPLAHLLYGFWVDDLTVNPIEYVTRELGDTALRLLLASLAITPLRRLGGWSALAPWWWLVLTKQPANWSWLRLATYPLIYTSLPAQQL